VPISREERLERIKEAYLRIPPRARNAGLVVLLVMGFFSLWDHTMSRSTASLERDLALVRKLQNQGKITDAVAKATELEKRYYDNSLLYMELGDLYNLQGRPEQAVTAYTKAHSLKPEQPLVHTRLLATYLRAGQQQEALGELEHVETQIKGDPPKDVIIEVARLFLEFKELKQPPEKTLILSRALQNDKAPDSTIGYILEAQTLFQMNRPQDAVQVMEKGLKIDATDDWLLENLVFARLAIKDVGGATSMAENWIRLKPKATKAMLVMAYLKYNSKNYPEALPFLQKILEVAGGNPNEPHHPEALNLMGQIYVQLNQSAQALPFFRKACESGFQQACDNELLKSAGNVPAPSPGAAPDATSVPAPASLPGASEPAATDAAPATQQGAPGAN
jgi:tetratricopeptide (TPR) repeat protein